MFDCENKYVLPFPYMPFPELNISIDGEKDSYWRQFKAIILFSLIFVVIWLINFYILERFINKGSQWSPTLGKNNLLEWQKILFSFALTFSAILLSEKSKVLSNFISVIYTIVICFAIYELILPFLIKN